MILISTILTEFSPFVGSKKNRDDTGVESLNDIKAGQVNDIF